MRSAQPRKFNFPAACLLFSLTMIAGTVGAQNANDAFGDSVPISNGLLGRIILLPDTTSRLPDFDTMTPLPLALYAKGIDVSERKWSAGFPGLRSRFEYFGVEYTTHFEVLDSGEYTFHLTSDDGSKMWIDDSLVIDYDGVHTAGTRTDSLFLKQGNHFFKLDYFQGPRYELALQLTYNRDTAKEQIFPGKDFILRTPKRYNWWPWMIGGLLFVCIMIYWKSKKAKPAKLVETN